MKTLKNIYFLQRNRYLWSVQKRFSNNFYVDIFNLQNEEICNILFVLVTAIFIYTWSPLGCSKLKWNYWKLTCLWFWLAGYVLTWIEGEFKFWFELKKSNVKMVIPHNQKWLLQYILNPSIPCQWPLSLHRDSFSRYRGETNSMK